MHYSFNLKITQKFIKLLSEVQPSSKPAVVCGDMNIAFEPSKPCSNQLSDKMNRKRFKQVVTYPTHIKGNILDHMYVRCPVQPLWKLHYPYYSDHDAIMLILRTGKQASQMSPWEWASFLLLVGKLLLCTSLLVVYESTLRFCFICLCIGYYIYVY